MEKKKVKRKVVYEDGIVDIDIANNIGSENIGLRQQIDVAFFKFKEVYDELLAIRVNIQPVKDMVIFDWRCRMLQALQILNPDFKEGE